MDNLKRLILLINILLFSSSIKSEIWNTDYGTFTLNGFLNYTWSNKTQTGYGSSYDGALISNVIYDNIRFSGRIGISKHNILRRAMFSIPFKILGTDVDIGGGRITNASGIYNVAIGNPSSNGLARLPNTVYDPIQLSIVTNNIDGGYVKLQRMFNNYGLKMDFYYGKPLLEDPTLGRHNLFKTGDDLFFTFDGKSSFIGEGTVYTSDLEMSLTYNRSINDVIATHYRPKDRDKIKIPNIYDEISLTAYKLGIKYRGIDNLSIISEISSIDYSLNDHNFYGCYLMGRYTINTNFETYIGISKGLNSVREPMTDLFAGLVFDYKNYNLLLEYHRVDTASTYYRDHSLLNNDDVFLISTTFKF